mmetsp:Transcript_103930/g.333148  ORF Transcript_103930/g.333148 Transcript_103930/m.333148 type:complete len:205 (-) Transcript_103930:722-1336(-)
MRRRRRAPGSRSRARRTWTPRESGVASCSASNPRPAARPSPRVPRGPKQREPCAEPHSPAARPKRCRRVPSTRWRTSTSPRPLSHAPVARAPPAKLRRIGGADRNATAFQTACPSSARSAHGALRRSSAAPALRAPPWQSRATPTKRRASNCCASAPQATTRPSRDAASLALRIFASAFRMRSSKRCTRGSIARPPPASSLLVG